MKLPEILGQPHFCIFKEAFINLIVQSMAHRKWSISVC